MKFAFYVSGASTRLLRFLDQATDKDIKQIKIVMSDDLLKEELKIKLEENKIKYIEIPYKSIKGVNNSQKSLELSNQLLRELDKWEIDYCFSFGIHILSGKLLEKYEMRIINFHPGLLPMFPGLNAIDQAVFHGNTLLVGNTAHFINKDVDAGPVIMQSIIPLEAFYENGNNYDCILDLQIEMLNDLIYLMSSNRITLVDGRVKIIEADYQKGAIFPHYDRSRRKE